VSDTILAGTHVRLEPLESKHAEALAQAAAGETELYSWSVVPQTHEQAVEYIRTAHAMRDAGRALPFAVVRVTNGEVIGSTRFFDIERWLWPASHPRPSESTFDACEIGYTWYAPQAIRTAVNTEAKLLLLTHAFETWHVLRVCLHTDARNDRSRAAIERLGAVFEGILRSHRLAADNTARDSARYSIVADEWPAIKTRLQGRLNDEFAARQVGSTFP
jgi:N-acetyltransferase